MESEEELARTTKSKAAGLQSTQMQIQYKAKIHHGKALQTKSGPNKATTVYTFTKTLTGKGKKKKSVPNRHGHFRKRVICSR